MRTLALLLAVAGCATFPVTTTGNVTHGKAKKAKKHRKHRAVPPTPRIKPGTAVPLTTPITTPPLAPPPGATPTPEATVPPPTPPPALPRTVGVTAKEFSLTLSRATVGAGLVTVELRNKGEDGHDLQIDAAGGLPVAAWDELAALSAPVTKVVAMTPGTYRLYCSLPGHAEAGMDTPLNVAG